MVASRAELARRIDHTALAPTVGRAEIARLCDEALHHGFRTVCVAPIWVEAAVAHLRGSAVGVCAVVGFPLGSTLPAVKAVEARAVVERGAEELDVVMSIGRFLEGDDRFVREELEAVVEAAGGRAVKVILESALLSPPELERACDLAIGAGAAFVKTSTGFGPSGATVEAVRAMRARARGRAGVKASGGIRDLERALALLRAGADRLGTSASVALVEALGEHREGA
jgi:deoxyribose-phosphate aldolase